MNLNEYLPSDITTAEQFRAFVKQPLSTETVTRASLLQFIDAPLGLDRARPEAAIIAQIAQQIVLMIDENNLRVMALERVCTFYVITHVKLMHLHSELTGERSTGELRAIQILRACLDFIHAALVKERVSVEHFPQELLSECIEKYTTGLSSEEADEIAADWEDEQLQTQELADLIFHKFGIKY